MKEISKKIIENFQTRKRKNQKSDFTDFLISELAENGIKVRVEEGGSLIKSRNIIVGNVSSASVIFTAHYDTAPKFPFPNFITPKNLPLYILYQLLLVFPLFLLCVFVSFCSVAVFDSVLPAYFLCCILCFCFIFIMMLGKENRNTVNDNTSGVITLCEIMLHMNEEQLEKAAFVFFDNEEIGLLGSAAFAKIHRRELGNKLIINFDCVSDGDTVMFVVNGKARKGYAAHISSAFGNNHGYEIKPYITKALTTVYPSDQMNFPVNIGVAALKRKKYVGYYLDKIHTKHDTVLREENIAYLTDSSIKLTDMIS